MLNTVWAIDAFIIRHAAEPLATWLTIKSGKNNVWWAKISVFMALFIMVLNTNITMVPVYIFAGFYMSYQFGKMDKLQAEGNFHFIHANRGKLWSITRLAAIVFMLLVVAFVSTIFIREHGVGVIRFIIVGIITPFVFFITQMYLSICPTKADR